MTGILAIETPRLIGALAVVLDVALKATALLALAWAVHLILGRRRAMARSASWNACLVGLLLLPAVAAALPRLRVVCLPVAAPPPTADTTPAPPERPASSIADPPLLHAAADWYERAVLAPRLDMPSPAADPPIAPAVAVPADRPAVAEPPAIADASPAAPDPRAWAAPVLLRLGLAAYAAVAGLLGIRLLVGLATVARLRRSARPVDDPSWTADLERWRGRLGIGRSVALGATDRVGVPVVVGWLRPAVLLPTGLVADASASTRDAVLLHELAHVRRGDYGWNLLARVAGLLYWPHPLTWPMGLAIRAAREQACDDLCVHHVGGAGPYRSALLTVAESRSRRPGPALGLAMASPTRLAGRLAWIDRTPGSPRCLSRRPLRLGLLAAAASLAGLIGAVELTRASAEPPSAPAADDEAANGPAEAPEVVEVLVTAGDTGEPLPGAIVRTSIDFVEVEVRTDDAGIARIDRSGAMITPETMSVDVWTDGYVQQRHAFGEGDPRYEPMPIPERLTVELLPGSAEIGGVVRDEAGVPIEGATVEFGGWLAEKRVPAEGCDMVRATTDSEGRWRSRSLRKMLRLDLHLEHPDYVSDTDFDSRPRVPLDELYAGTNEQVMARGVPVAGRVDDDDGVPVAGAVVALVTDRDQPFNDTIRTATDADGRFRFPHARPGTPYLLVKAEGHAPALLPIAVAEGEPPADLSIRVGPARVLEGRVVDPDGEPIAGALVNADVWRGVRSLGVYLRSDADGRFRWDSAPPDAVEMDVSKRFYVAPIREDATAGGAVETFVLRPTMLFAGTIRDSETGVRIGPCQVVAGLVDPESGEVTWRDPWEGSGTTGSMVTVPIEGAGRIKLRITAPGYAPLVTEEFEAGQRLVAIDGALSRMAEAPADAVTGVVRLPDGSPMAGATVAVSTGSPRIWVHLDRGVVSDPNGQITTTETDAEGRFTLPPQPEPFAIIALGDACFAEATHDQLKVSSELTAQPWGRIEGRAFVGTEPAAGHRIRIFSRRLRSPIGPYIGNGDTVVTDAEGRFRFRHVLPGYAYLATWMGTDDDYRGARYHSIVPVEPGETTDVTIGRTGRPVVGRIAPPEGFGAPVDLAAEGISLSIETNTADLPIPPDALAEAEGVREPLDEFHGDMTSPAAIAYARSRVRMGQLRLEPDGRFRVEDMPAGDYRLEVSITGNSPSGFDPKGRRLAPLKHFFTVPEMPGGRSDEPLDLGTIAIRLRNEPPAPGEPVPPFAVETLDGRTVRPEDYRGRILLLNFWAPWNDLCLFQVPHLRNLRASYPADELAILNLCPSGDAEQVRRFIEAAGVAGEVAFLGQWSSSEVIADYGVVDLPVPLLIGPDGRVLESDIGGLYNDHYEGLARERIDELLGR